MKQFIIQLTVGFLQIEAIRKKEELLVEKVNRMDEKIKSQLLDIDLTALRAKVIKEVKNPQFEEINRNCNAKIQKVLGPEFEIDTDLADYVHYCYPNMNIEFACLFIMLNQWLFSLDDHLDHFPDGIYI